MNAGEVQIKLGDETLTLRSTLRAAKEINSVLGNYTEAFRKVLAYDLSAFVAVVAAGAGKTTREVELAVHSAGLPDLLKPVTDYLGLLSNGGRPLVAADVANPGDGNEGEA